MDVKDRRILAELLLNSRIPVSKLAKNVGVSREVALYRLNRLIREKVILGFYTILDTETLGYSRYTCFFQLRGISNLKEKEFLHFLTEHKFVTYLSPVIGKWNVVFDLLAKSKNHLHSLTKEITDYIKPYIEYYQIISTATEQEIFSTKLVGIKKEMGHKRTAKKIELDNKDQEILKLISINSRTEYVEMSKKLKLTPNAIKYRLKKMEASGIIKQYIIAIDVRKLNYEWYNLQLKLIENKKEAQLKQFFKQQQSVIYYYKYLKHKNWDFDIGVIVKNSLELRGFILDLKEHFGDILKINDTYSITEELKWQYSPEGIFD